MQNLDSYELKEAYEFKLRNSDSPNNSHFRQQQTMSNTLGLSMKPEIDFFENTNKNLSCHDFYQDINAAKFEPQPKVSMSLI
jgi:hypothetical protein